MAARVDLVGKRFGRWTVAGYAGERKWRCVCQCGSQVDVDGRSLRRGASTGCQKCRPPSRLTHGGTGTRLYKIWEAMKRRCLNKSDPRYAYYGGRGITVCDDWAGSFSNFRLWAEQNGYAPALTIDRINNNSGYNPDNCRWATKAEQNRNYSRNRYVTYAGETYLLVDLALRIGMNQRILGLRVFRYGWSVERAISTPVASRIKREPWKAKGISRSAYYRMLKERRHAA